MSQFVLGRGELKNFFVAMLFLGIVFLIQIPVISAQEEQSSLPEISVEQRIRAQEQAFTFGDDNFVVTSPAGPSVWSIIRMILVLILVAVSVYGVVFLFRKAARPAPSTDPFLKVLANVHLGTNRYAHIVSVGSKAWLVGASENGVSLISEIEDKEIIDAMLLEDSRKSGQGGGGFPDFISLLRRVGIRAQSQEEAPAGAEDIRKRRERLQGL